MFGSVMYKHNMIDKKFEKTKMSYTSYYEQALHIDAPDGSPSQMNKYQGVMPPGPADFDEDITVDDKSAGSDSHHHVEALKKSILSKANGADQRKYMDDYFARVFVVPETKKNHNMNIDGDHLDPRLEQKQNLSEALRDYFSMTIDVPGNFTYNVGD